VGDEPIRMKPASPEQALFAEALQCAAPKARAAYLDGACGTDAALRRRVALKVIKLGMDTRSVVARFEAERQALALMDHPNIAKVLDGGAAPTGRPLLRHGTGARRAHHPVLR
jgi:hypothetical protein